METFSFWKKQIVKSTALSVFLATFILVGLPGCETGETNMNEFLDQPSCGDCEEEEPPIVGPAEGCTPGFWRQDHHYEYWTNYSPSDQFNSVFGVADPENPTLGEAIDNPGPGVKILRFHAVAGLLNASSPEVNYTYTESEVKQMVQQAYATGDYEHYKNLLAEANEAGGDCPVDKGANN